MLKTCIRPVLALAWLTGGADALTIYRIGGSSLPVPELAEGMEFVQLDWESVESAQHGQVELLKIDGDFIEPEQLDPSINLTPRLKERGAGCRRHPVWAGSQAATPRPCCGTKMSRPLSWATGIGRPRASTRATRA